MSKRHLIAICFGLVSIFFVSNRGAAEMLPTLPVRYMAIEADVIVVGEPVDATAGKLPSRFKVIELFKGPEELVGQTVVIRYVAIYELLSRKLLLRKNEEEPPPPTIAKALLFLRNPSPDRPKEGYGTVLSGIRAMTSEGELLVPQQDWNPGPQFLVPRSEIHGPAKDLTWEAMLERVRADLPKIEEIRALQNIADHAERNRAIFAWVGRHKNEFGGGWLTEAKGWGPLESELFDWVMESYRPEDCWKAIELSSELGTGPQHSYGTFCSTQGRELLLTKVFDKQLPPALQLKALDYLGNGGTYWYASYHRPPGTSIITGNDQRTIIERILPLLEHDDPVWRAAAVRCLMSVSWPYDANFKEMATKQAVSQLADLYRTEENAEVRRQIVETLRRLEDEAFWEKLTGNPHGIVVFVGNYSLKDELIAFQLNLDYTPAKLTEKPRFRFEPRENLRSSEPTQVIEATVKYPAEVFSKGWEDWQGLIVLDVPTSQLKPGKWRVTVEGKYEDRPWRSEWIEVEIPASSP